MQTPNARGASAPGEPRPDGSHVPQLTLLGGFTLTCSGRQVPLSTPARRLLALTALSPALLDRERAAGELWPDLPAERARGNLRNALWRLRRACPALLLDASDHLAIAPALRVDVHELTRLAQGLDTPDADQHDLFEVDALSLLAELLPGWPEEWLTMERERLHSVGLHVLERLALHRAAAGRLVGALDAAYLAVRADPLRESAVSALVQVHLTQGNRIEALRAYTAFRQRVRDELGMAVEPLPELRQYLVEAFRSGNEDGEAFPSDAAMTPAE